MDDEYEHNTQEVMDYLVRRSMSKYTVRLHKECFARLASYLKKGNLSYTEELAWEWFEEASKGLNKTARSIYASALGKLGDLYAAREIKPYHYRAPTIRERLNTQHRQILDGYCDHLLESGLALATVRNHRRDAIHFLLDLQERGVEFVADATYSDLIAILLVCEQTDYSSMTRQRGEIRSVLTYLHSNGLVRFGFTLLVDAMALGYGYCWNDVDPLIVEELRESQAGDTRSIALEDYLDLVDSLVSEHRSCGYSYGPICSVSHFGNLLYLFMDINGLHYEPRIGCTWLESMEHSLSSGEFKVCRRILILLAQSYEGVAHDLSRSFRLRKTLRDRLPEWCAPQVDAFLATKEAEGWKKSTLVMFRTCVCRFCMFVDGAGVVSFAEITAEHIKRFNAEDPHATPEGKNAFNSRIRQFLEWLGCRGELSNPYLFLALPSVAASKETAVVTLTPNERSELERALDCDKGPSLRDKAMLQLGLRMGIRASDVVGLQASDISWVDATVRFTQAKTGYEVNLPMPADVGNAVYHYIVDERPESDETSVFLRCKAPYTSLGANAAQESLHKALPDRDVPGSGFHSLRKTFASGMLRGGAEPAQVAEALGHRGINNVRKYLHLDEDRMRLCAISLEESGLALEGGLSYEA